MSGRNVNKQRLFATLSFAAFLCVFTSCASSSPETPAGADAAAAPSDASLLDESAKVTSADAGAFADLEAKSAPVAEEKKASAEATPVADGSSDTYYNSMGGETLRRVAFTLYSDRSFARKLLDKNPDLKGVSKLGADQKVFFDMESARPEPRFLTKDLLDRYADSLAQRMNAEVAERKLATTTITVNKGETLQDVSQRLYGTHRYWTEIYLVNKDKIQNYDKVAAGITLSVVDRPNMGGVAKADASEAVSAPAPVSAPTTVTPETKPVPVVAPIEVLTNQAAPPPPVAKPEPVVAQPQPIDPIPETPAKPVAEAPPLPAPVAEAPKPFPQASNASSARVESSDTGSSNSSLRRILYVALILLIGGAAFYFTRTPKRSKVDMLDLNAEAGSRQKLPAKDSQKNQTG